MKDSQLTFKFSLTPATANHLPTKINKKNINSPLAIILAPSRKLYHFETITS